MVELRSFPRFPGTAPLASLPDLPPQFPRSHTARPPATAPLASLTARPPASIPWLPRPPNPAKLSSLSPRLGLVCHLTQPLSYPPASTSVNSEPSLAKPVLISFLPKPQPCPLSVTVLQTFPSGRPEHAE
jgi:hypothetical protein